MSAGEPRPPSRRKKKDPWYKQWGLAALRSWRTILVCLPAVLAAFAVVMVGQSSAGRATTRELIDKYKREFERSANAKEDPRSLVCLERLRRLEPAQPKHTFQLALVNESLGERRRAFRLMRSLAPPDRAGYGPAQVLWARNLMRGELDATRAADAEAHLRHALTTTPNDPEALQLLAVLLFRAGDAAKAMDVLGPVASKQPGAQLMLAAEAVRAGRRTEAEALSLQAEKGFAAGAEAHPADPSWVVNQALARAVRGDDEGAIQLLEARLDRAKPEPEVLMAAGNAFAEWVSRPSLSGPAQRSRRVELLLRAQRSLPGHPSIQAPILRELIDPEGREEAVRQFETLLSDPRAAHSTHFLLGGSAYQLGLSAKAKHHFQEAHRLFPSEPNYANNLAWLLADGDEADRGEALKIIDGLVSLEPKAPRFHGTKGHVLLRDKKWRDALAELETGLKGEPDNIDLHRDLADAYEALGMTDLAAGHRAKATKRVP